jgi:peptidoglycan/xylan/chitin deacetylase (PgdA/CDA1 family)
MRSRPALLFALAAVVALVSSDAVASARTRRPRDTPVPILMYHVIAPAPRSVTYPHLYVRPSDFARQMRWLARHGFRAVTMQRVYDHWRRGVPLPSKPVVISFDDGYRSIFTAAFPVLRAKRWPGVVNLKVGNTTDRFGLPPALVRALIAAGWEIDAHTITHPDLTTVGSARLRSEVRGSRRWIRRTFHVPAAFFCYPYGRYDARVRAAVRAAGFLGATTTEYGLARPSELYTLDRVRIDGGDGLIGFVAKLRAF